MEKGDIVKIQDGSWAIRLDKMCEYNSIGLCRDKFEIIHTTYGIRHEEHHIHDIVIKNKIDGKVYLHSSSFVRKVTPEPKAKEMTISDVEKLVGRNVKIVK